MRGLRSFHLLLVLAFGFLTLLLLRPGSEPSPPAYWQDNGQVYVGDRVLDATATRR